MWIAGIVLIAVGVVLFFVRQSQLGKLTQVLAAERISCEATARLCRELGEAMGGPTGPQVELKGTIEPRQPLRAELSGRDCVCCRTRVVREWEEERWETDSEGHSRRKTERGTDTMSQNERREPFFVRDESGRILVDPQDAEIDWVESLDKFEPGEAQGGVLSFGGFTLSLGGLAAPGARRTLGYRYNEWILPPQHPVYVLGGAALRGGEPCIARPAEKGRRYLISVKSEEAILAGARRAALWLAVAMGVCWAAGLALILAGLLRR